MVLGRLLGKVFQPLRPAPRHRRGGGRHLLGPSLLGRIWPEPTTSCFPTKSPPPSRHHRPARRHPVHVPGRAGAQRRRAPRRAARRSPFRTPASSCRSCSGRRWRLWSLSAAVERDVPFTSFALFLGVAMSITAFPVLARILTDRRMSKTDAGRDGPGLRRHRRRRRPGACWRWWSAWCKSKVSEALLVVRC